MTDAKARSERALFETFAPLAGFHVAAGSIRQSDPPSPDIECSLNDGNPVAVELVALDHPDTRTRLENMMRTKECWREASGIHPPEVQADLVARTRDMFLICDFSNDAGTRQRREVFAEVQRAILALPFNFEGAILPHLANRETAALVERIQVARGGTAEMRISAASVGGWLPLNQGKLVEKLTAKKYVTKAPLHLFAYSEHDPLDGHVNSLRELRDAATAHIATSQFVAVHFFDWWGPKYHVSITKSEGP